jgi:hypothetical protein
MEIRNPPHLDWRVLNSETQLATKDGKLVAIAYAAPATDSHGRKWFEFGWLPADQPDLVDVHFGVAPGTGDAWDQRWERARRATEWELTRRGLS